ncbi:MAG: transporter [Herbinix sp.]|nr:transporter [Herbinix sp.]
MKPLSRTEYSLKNAYITTILKVIAILMGYVVRVVFTHTLSESYVGINGLFTELLNVIALSELGIESAITYALYRPIAENNREEQKSLMRIYGWYYRAVAVTVTLLGLFVIPFIPVLIKNQSEVEHLTLIYLLYLTNSALSYLIIYKKSLMDAHQLFYLGLLYQTGFWVVQDVLQIIILITTKNFILFLLIYIICTLIGNIFISKKANRLYPYIKEKNIKPLEDLKKQEIAKNIRALFLHKIGDVVMGNTDNILLSSFVGIMSTGIYSNYYLIIQSINQLIHQIFHGITASIGNLGVGRNVDRVKIVYQTTYFIAHWVYGLGAICLYELLNPFVRISFGEKYLFSKDIVLLLCINFFVTGLKNVTLVFRNSLGLFRHDRYISIACAAFNLVFSILLVRRFGTIGVFIGTLISILLTSAWLEPYIIYKFYLNRSFYQFLLRYVWYHLSIGMIWFFVDYLCQLLKGNSMTVILVRLVTGLIVPNLILGIIYFRSVELRSIILKINIIFNKMKKGRGLG